MSETVLGDHDRGVTLGAKRGAREIRCPALLVPRQRDFPPDRISVVLKPIELTREDVGECGGIPDGCQVAVRTPALVGISGRHVTPAAADSLDRSQSDDHGPRAASLQL